VETLKHEEVVRLHEAIVSSQLARNRDALLIGIPPEIVAGLPPASGAAAQILTDIGALNNLGRLADGSLPLRAWMKNAVTLSKGRVECDVLREALRKLESEHPAGVASIVGIGGSLSSGVAVWIGATLLVGSIATVLALRGHGSGDATGDAGAPIAQGPAPASSPSAPQADAPTASASTRGAETRPPGGGSGPKPQSSVAPSTPAVSATQTAAATANVPAVAKSGTATLSGRFWSLGVPVEALGGARVVCLNPSQHLEALRGVQPTCSVAAGSEMAICSRSDAAKQVPLGNNVSWRSPCR
jgi:Effector-associated domain 5